MPYLKWIADLFNLSTQNYYDKINGQTAYLILQLMLNHLGEKALEVNP